MGRIQNEIRFSEVALCHALMIRTSMNLRWYKMEHQQPLHKVVEVEGKHGIFKMEAINYWLVKEYPIN